MMYIVIVSEDSIVGKFAYNGERELSEDMVEVQKELYEKIVDFPSSYEIRDGQITLLPDIEKLKQQKYTEVSKACNEEILAGFYSAAKNGRKHYDFSYEDQINLNGIFTSILAGNTQLEWKNSSQLVCEPWTKEEFLVLYNDAMSFKTEKIRRCHSLKLLISNMATAEELEGVTWESGI